MKQYHILVLVLFTTSKPIPVIEYCKFCVRVAPRVVERLKHDIFGNSKYWENLKVGWRKSLMPGPPSKNKTLAIATKKLAEKDVEVSRSCRIWLDLFASSH